MDILGDSGKAINRDEVVTVEEFKKIEEQNEIHRKYYPTYEPKLVASIAVLLADYKELNAEVKRLEEMADRAINSTGEQAYEQGRDDGYREGLEDGKEI